MGGTRMNVYQALRERIRRIFGEYDYVYLSFSGGKDSGVLLNACVEHIRQYGGRMGVFHMDYEVQYSLTTEYVDEMLSSNRDILDVYRCCVPFKVGSAASMYQRFWRPWDPCVRWVREMPVEYLGTEAFDFYTPQMWDYEFQECFSFWLRKQLGVQKVACLVGIRTQESFNRWRTIYRSTPGPSADWICPVDEGIDNVYPLYDWHTTDIWTANGRFRWKYNRLYDLYYQAGVPLNSQRVASPFISQAIPTQESFNRWRTIYRSTPGPSADWICPVDEGIDNVYPLYDWHTTDIWTANGRFRWKYNRLYDLYYQAGVPLNSQRVASPFISQAIPSLHLYRVIEPEMWGKMLGRVNGVNFAGGYGNSVAMGWRGVRLPEGMTWKKYLFFLLDTLPEDARNNYLDKLEVSVRFWREKGGCLAKETIMKLKRLNIPFELGGTSGYRTHKLPVRMEYLDDIDLPEFRELPSYKRMCICILKNDHCCKYMGFSPNKQEQERRRKMMDEYRSYFNE